MPAISFSCEEKKQALIAHKCNQTIRPKGKREIKVGDKLTLYWHQRSKQSCNICIKRGSCGAPEFFERDRSRDCQSLGYSNVLGYGEVTEVFDIDIEVWTKLDLRFIVNVRDIHKIGGTYTGYGIRDLAKADSFETVWDFIKWFDTHYDLRKPKKFTVIRWKWIEAKK